jgi:hypothetical protein
MINQIKQLIGIKTIAEHSGKTERQVYNMLNRWKKGINKADKHILQSAIDEKIDELTALSNKISNN